MAYTKGTPNGRIYIGSVKWDNKYKDVMYFSSEGAQADFFNSNFTKINANIIFAHPDKHIDIDTKIESIEKRNYINYINDDDVTKTWYHCFITGWDYIAPNTTRLYLELDVFQQFIYRTTFYRSFIKRAHIPKSQDSLFKWTQPEPFSFAPSYEKQIDVFNNIDWGANWLYNAVSGTNPGDTGDFYYGGVGNKLNGTFTSIYALPSSHTNINRYLKKDDVGDHRGDVISITACPMWVLKAGYFAPNADTTSDGYLNGNKYVTVTDEFTFSTTTLPCGYVPKNKKLLNSAFRIIAFFNYNGFYAPLKPELFQTANPKYSISYKPLDSTAVRLYIGNYNEPSQRQWQIPYNASMGASYNQNVGLQQKISVLNGVTSMATSIGGGVASAQSGNALGLVNALSGVVNAGANLKSAFEQKTATIGQGSDTMCIEEDNIRLRCIDASPTYDECQAIDDYLTAYGYAINSIEPVSNFLKNRSAFNYIETDNIVVNLWCAIDWKNKFTSIFNNGVRLWHDYTTFGQLGTANN